MCHQIASQVYKIVKKIVNAIDGQGYTLELIKSKCIICSEYSGTRVTSYTMHNHLFVFLFRRVSDLQEDYCSKDETNCNTS